MHPDSTLKIDATGATFCRLKQFSALRVSGPDAESFLQNLLSNDIRDVSGTQAQLSSFNTAKGRMLASFLIWRDNDDYLLQLPETLGEALRRKLALYVLRAKVKITDAGNEVAALGLSGVDVHKILPALGCELPQRKMGLSCTDPIKTIRLDDNRFLLIASPAAAETLVEALDKRAHAVADAYWDWLNIRAGIPVILPATQEEFVPQMVNFDLIGGINFKKGCYPGQEIVARMHYLGKLKRRMYLAHLESEAAPQPGDELYSADMEGQASGMIANAAAAPGGGYDVLAVVQITSHAEHSVHLGSLQGAKLTFEGLPYPLP